MSDAYQKLEENLLALVRTGNRTLMKKAFDRVVDEVATNRFCKKALVVFGFLVVAAGVTGNYFCPEILFPKNPLLAMLRIPFLISLASIAVALGARAGLIKKSEDIAVRINNEALRHGNPDRPKLQRICLSIEPAR